MTGAAPHLHEGSSGGLLDSPLLRPYRRGALVLPNRLAMAPMTRGRSDDQSGVPHAGAAVYYAQRAAAGMIISEGVWPDASGKNGPGQPGLATGEQVAGWRRVTTAVHAAGGRIFAQLWHAGRVSHPRTLPGGHAPMGPSPVAMKERIFVRDGWVDPVRPEPLSVDEIGSTVEAYANAASNAVRAGFDGVELHGANGYLIHQFLADNTNLRTDDYGGSLTNRLRFAVEVVDAVVAAVGAFPVGLRLSPGNPINEIAESDPASVYRALLDALGSRDLAYVHLVEAGEYPAIADLRSHWPGTLIGNLSGSRPMSFADGERLLEADLVDVLAYGRLFLANPDLPLRLITGASLADAQREHYYASSIEGYIDHPSADPQLTGLARRLIDQSDEEVRSTDWAWG